MSIILDVVILAIVILLVVLGYKHGFIRTVVNLLGYIISAVLAFLVSSPVAGWIFQTFFRDKAFHLINSELAGLTAGMSVKEMVDAALQAVPEKLMALVPQNMLDGVENMIADTAQTTSNVASVIVDGVLGPAAIMILQSVLFIILFILFCVVVKLIARQLKFINKIPFVGKANEILGMILGLVQAVVFVFIFTSIAALVIQISGNQLDFINDAVVQESVVFKAVYEINPLSQIS